MKHLGSTMNWMLFECSEFPDDMLRVAYNTQMGTWHHVCDSASGGWDPDPFIPQNVIDIHLHAITPKA
jgi:hypothetical protein